MVHVQGPHPCAARVPYNGANAWQAHGRHEVPPLHVIMTPLPVDGAIGEVREHLARHRAAVLTAGPGAGKTTRIPAALIDAGPVIVLQPRRVAVRAVARCISDERGWTLGGEIGWQVRFEKRFTRDTRLLVVTEGILTARLQQDPLLSDFTTVVFDEFHERSLHADLGLALARQAWLARDDLRILVMSATLDHERVAHFLGGCPVVQVPGALHPLATEYAPGESLRDAVAGLLTRTSGQVLCFLPGAREIAAAQRDLAHVATSMGVEIVPLHGSLDADAQDEAIRAATGRRVILATNIAETSLTVPGVSAVVDTGLVKVARHDAARGVDSLTLERVTRDSADQRAGRAARLGPGVVRRLWDARDRLRPHREPDIARVDLASALLDVLAWGGDPHTFEWFEAPSHDRTESALVVLRRLRAITTEGRPPRLTELGRRLQRVPLHPRLARILIDGRGAPEIAMACALLTERVAIPSNGAVALSCDLWPSIEQPDRLPSHVRQVARELQRIAASVAHGDSSTGATMDQLRHALFTGYADRLARRRDGDPGRVKLASGHGATIGRESGVRDGEYLVALELVAAERDGIAESRIRIASRVEPEWIEPTESRVEHRLDANTGRVQAVRVAAFDEIVLSEHSVAPDPAVAAAMLREAWMQRRPDEATTRLLRRARFAGIEIDLPALAHQASLDARSLDDIDIEAHLPYDTRRALDALAPTSLIVPSGRTKPLDYTAEGTVAASVKLQELFGLAESPAIGPARSPVVFHLLAPNGRPVQTTRDLRSFWERTYPEVRRELRGRYPKHPWPEDPWTAPATHRTVKRR